MLIPDSIASRIRTAIEKDGLGFAIDREAATHGAIALFGTIGAIYMLRPDGTFWIADEDFGTPLQPLEPNLQISALVGGTERFPWLSSLLPARPKTAPDCGTCGGSGHLGKTRDKPGVFCPDCDALGWIPGPEVQLDAQDAE